MSQVETVSIDIRPQSNVYATYRRLAYKPWFAIGEFVDNSTQNFFDHRDEIERVTGSKPTLTVEIIYDPHQDRLCVIDNANGMEFEELQRAVQLYRPPANRSGRSEFGMGLKTAACWLGEKWRIVTKRLGSETEYEVEVDVSNLEANQPEQVSVLKRHGQDPLLHYTRIEIERLYRKFRGPSIKRIRDHLASMYRRDLASGEVVITWNGEPLSWEQDPPYEEILPDGTRQQWIKEVEFDVSGYKVKGRIWICLPGSARKAGLALFRRGRLIVGGLGENYKPEEIFGAPNSFQSQRLFGELDMDDWPVTQTKDAFDWAGDLEHEFIMKLREVTHDYVQKAQQIRSDDGRNRPTVTDGQLAGDATKDVLASPAVDEAMAIVETVPPEDVPQEEAVARIQVITRDAADPTTVRIGSEGLPTLKVWWLDSRAESDIYAEFAVPHEDLMYLTVNLNHPFVVNVLQRDPDKLALWAQMLYVDALVERAAMKHGRNLPASAFRQFKDVYLRRIRAE